MIESPLLQPEEKVPLCAEIRVEDFDVSLSYYTEKLGFSLFRIDPPNKFACLKFGEAFFMIKEEKGLGAKGGGFFFRMRVKDLDAYYQQLQERGAKTLGPPQESYWGSRRFYAQDPDGFKIQFIPGERDFSE